MKAKLQGVHASDIIITQNMIDYTEHYRPLKESGAYKKI